MKIWELENKLQGHLMIWSLIKIENRLLRLRVYQGLDLLNQIWIQLRTQCEICKWNERWKNLLGTLIQMKCMFQKHKVNEQHFLRENLIDHKREMKRSSLKWEESILERSKSNQKYHQELSRLDCWAVCTCHRWHKAIQIKKT